MTRRPALALLVLLVLAPFPAAAQPGDPGRRIEAATRQAQAAGIPVALLESKVAEGRAKHVPADRIAAAVERRLASLVRARDVMRGPRGEAVAAADLAVGADALEAGVDPAALRALATTAPASHRAVAVAVLTQLVQGGEPSAQALERVRAALARSPEELRSLPAQAQARGRGNGNSNGSGPPPGRGGGNGRGNASGGNGRQGAGPPASVPGPGDKPGRGGGRGGGKKP